MPDFAAEIEQTLADVTSVMGRTVTLRRVGRGASITVGAAITRTETNVDQTLKANLVAERQVAGSASFAGAGSGGERPILERVYEVQASIVTIGTPVKSWRVIDGSDTLEVVAVDADCDSRNLILTCRRTL